jgi:hypothetical protein
MAERITRQLVAEKALVHPEAALTLPHTVDRNFELPAALYIGTAAGYLGFLGLMTVAFGNPGLIIPMAIFVVFIAMLFGVAAMWMRMKPEHPQRLTAWNRFRRQGIMTAYGHSTAGAATVQVLILPGLILLWGVAVTVIAAVVR